MGYLYTCLLKQFSVPLVCHAFIGSILTSLFLLYIYELVIFTFMNHLMNFNLSRLFYA